MSAAGLAGHALPVDGEGDDAESDDEDNAEDKDDTGVPAGPVVSSGKLVELLRSSELSARDQADSRHDDCVCMCVRR